jgi:hypothetical protein
MEPSTIDLIGLPWYELEDYERVKVVMADGHLLPDIYSVWRLKAEQIERQLRRQGHRTVRAPLRADEFAAWCAARGHNVDAKGRTEYAAWFAHQQSTTRH